MLKEKEGLSDFEVHVGISELLLSPEALTLPSTQNQPKDALYEPRLYNLSQL